MENGRWSPMIATRPLRAIGWSIPQAPASPILSKRCFVVTTMLQACPLCAATSPNTFVSSEWPSLHVRTWLRGTPAFSRNALHMHPGCWFNWTLSLRISTTANLHPSAHSSLRRDHAINAIVMDFPLPVLCGTKNFWLVLQSSRASLPEGGCCSRSTTCTWWRQGAPGTFDECIVKISSFHHE